MMSPERTFQALTTDEVERWWGSPETYHVTDWLADLRVGGRWSMMVRRPDGGLFPVMGEFLEIEAPHKLLQTRKHEWDHPQLGRRETDVGFHLPPTANDTRLTVRHDGFLGMWQMWHPACEQAPGWERFLGWLAA